MRTTATSFERASTTNSRCARGGERHGGGAVANMHRADTPAVVDGVDDDILGAEIADVEQGVVARDEAADRVVAHHVGALHIVGAGDDFRDGVAERS